MLIILRAKKKKTDEIKISLTHLVNERSTREKHTTISSHKIMNKKVKLFIITFKAYRN